MLTYFLRRILFLIVTVLIVTLAVFLLLGARPSADSGHMVRYADDTGTEDTGVFAQYLRYCEHAFLRGDFGINQRTRKSNMTYILPRFLGVLKLTGISLVFTLALGIPAGIASAIWQNRWQDRVLSLVTTLISAFPAFCMSLAVIFILALKFRWFHVIQTDPKDYVMPVIALSLCGIATICRMTRSAMLEVLSRPHITALRALGIRERSVIWKHALRNALVPVASALSLLIGQILFSAVVVERFFNLPGGLLIADISNHSPADLISVAVILTVLMCLINIAADAVFLIVNPAIRGSLLRRGRRSVRSSLRGGAANG